MANKKFYGVKVGRISGVYKTWDECKKQIDGFKGAIFKSFSSAAAAQEYVTGAVAEKAVEDSLDNSTENYNIYVDGSFNNARHQYSWAFVVYNGTQLIHQACGVGDNTESAAMHNVAGELAAAMRAITWALEENIKPVILHHDYMGIAAWAVGDWQAKNKFTKAYAYFVKPHLNWLKFNKVLGHSGVTGNELADKLAGEAMASLEHS